MQKQNKYLVKANLISQQLQLFSLQPKISLYAKLLRQIKEINIIIFIS
jgi:hypothetical protein